jgi:hypothetical protein
MNRILTKTGYGLEQISPLDWKVLRGSEEIGQIQGLEAWKVWHLLEHEASPSNKPVELPLRATFREARAHLERSMRSTEAKRIHAANCHGTRQYLEDPNGEIGMAVDPYCRFDDGWNTDDHDKVATSFDEAFQRFKTPFSFGFLYGCTDDALQISHSGRILSKEGVTFEKWESGESFLLRTIQEIQQLYEDRLIYTQRFPLAREQERCPQLPLSHYSAIHAHVDLELPILARNESAYFNRIRSAIEHGFFIPSSSGE